MKYQSWVVRLALGLLIIIHLCLKPLLCAYYVLASVIVAGNAKIKRGYFSNSLPRAAGETVKSQCTTISIGNASEMEGLPEFWSP